MKLLNTFQFTANHLLNRSSRPAMQVSAPNLVVLGNLADGWTHHSRHWLINACRMYNQVYFTPNWREYAYHPHQTVDTDITEFCHSLPNLTLLKTNQQHILTAPVFSARGTATSTVMLVGGTILSPFHRPDQIRSCNTFDEVLIKYRRSVNNLYHTLHYTSPAVDTVICATTSNPLLTRTTQDLVINKFFASNVGKQIDLFWIYAKQNQHYPSNTVAGLIQLASNTQPSHKLFL